MTVAPVVVMDYENVLWRAGGANRELKWAQFMIAPYLHDGAVADMWVRISDILLFDGKCLASQD